MAILHWKAAPILFSRPLLLGLQLHSPFLLKHMSLEGGTKGSIICSSEQAEHSQNRAFPFLPPLENRRATPALTREHLHMKSCRRHRVPWLSCLPPPQVVPSREGSSEAAHLWTSYLCSWLDGKFKLQFNLRKREMRFVFFKTTKNSLLILLIFQKELFLKVTAFSGRHR